MKKALLMAMAVYSTGLFGMYGASNQWSSDNNLWSTNESSSNQDNNYYTDTQLASPNEYDTPSLYPSQDQRDCDRDAQQEHEAYVNDHFDSIDHEIVVCEVRAENESSNKDE
jgi:hypothetical protein